MAHMDIFNQRAFHQVELVDALDRVPHKPQFLGSLGIFEARPVRTTTVSVEERNGALELITTSPRGAPLEQADKQKRNIRDFRTVRLAKGDRLMADEIQDIRAFGSTSEMVAVMQEIMRRAQSLRDDAELTHEHMRLGAIMGKVLDADGTTVIRDWFAEWGISQPDEIDFALGTATTEVRTKCHGVIRAMQRAAAGSWTPGTTVHALVGDNFFDALISHKSVKETYLNWAAASDLRGNMAFESFPFGGITFHNYRGTDDNSTVAVHADKCHFFPVGARKVFQVAYSPAETFDFVNTPGRPFYPMIIPDRDRNAFVDLEIYSYPLHICTRPHMLQRAKRA